MEYAAAIQNYEAIFSAYTNRERALEEDGAVVITLKSGDIVVDRPFIFPSIAGSHNAPSIIFRSPPNGVSRIIGSSPLGSGTPFPSPAVESLLSPEARRHVVAYPLAPDNQLKITGEAPIAMADAPPASIMLTQGGVPLVQARWPAKGYFKTQASVGPDLTPTFTAPSDRTESWSREPDLRAGGYWSYDWSYETVRLKVDGKSSIVSASKLASPYALGKIFRYFIYNAISELRGPGEFAISPATHELLVWPRLEGVDAPPVRLVKADNLLVIDGASNVTFEGIEFVDSLDTAIKVTNSNHVVFRNDLVANTGGAGIVISGGQFNRIERTVVADTGSWGVVLSGGDRRTLNAANHVLTQSIIVRTGQRARTNHAAVQILGVGNTVSDSLITDAPHSAIQFAGNDHHIVRNEISDVVTETADAGAVYTGRDTSARGNIMQDNFIHDVYAREGGPEDVRGIYLDDFSSGDIVKNNTFLRVRDPIYINGGSYNVIQGNAFYETIGDTVTVRNANDQWGAEYHDVRGNAEAAFENPALYQKRYSNFKLPQNIVAEVPSGNVIENLVTNKAVRHLNLRLDIKFAGDARLRPSP